MSTKNHQHFLETTENPVRIAFPPCSPPHPAAGAGVPASRPTLTSLHKPCAAGKMGLEKAGVLEETRVKYKVVIHKGEEGGYWAEVPAVPGCCSEGETPDEVMRNIREALAGCLDALDSMGKQVTEDVEVREIAV